MRLWGTVLPAAMVWLASSCSDDEMWGGSAAHGGAQLRFAVQEVAPVATRSASDISVKELEQDAGGGKPLYLHTSVQQGIRTAKSPREVVTRGTVLTENSFWERFSLFAHSYPSGKGGNFTPDFFNNLCVKRTSAVGEAPVYAPENTYYLPAQGTDVTFYALAPYSADLLPRNNQTDILTQLDGVQTPSFPYQVPWYATNQQDLCFTNATQVAGGQNGTVTLNFLHALTAIRIVAAASMPKGLVKEIRILNVYGKGVYTPGTGNQPGTWSNLDYVEGKKYLGHDSEEYDNLKMDVEMGGKEVLLCGDNSPYVLQTGKKDNTFFMLPQTLGADVVMELDYVPEGESKLKKLTASLAGQEWKMGTTVTYTLSTSGMTLEITPNEGVTVGDDGAVSASFKASAPTFTVTSKRGSQAVDYKLQFSNDGGQTWVENTDADKPGMIGSTPKTDNNNGTWTHTININKGVTYIPEGDAKTLRQAAWADRNNYNGLIPSGGSSANCYIVSRPGYSRFRAVYGNSWKNNGANSAVLTGEFVNGKGDKITEPQLPDGITMSLIWEDVEGLVKVESKPEGTGINKFVYIIVGGSKETYQHVIQPGNALIGAYKDGVLLWSWHIWVTPDPGHNKITNGRDFLKIPVGYVRGGTAAAVPRSCQVRAVATDPQTHEEVYSEPITINQSGDDYVPAVVPGRYPTFQWGRKEPMWPSSKDFSDQSGMPLYGPKAPTSIVSQALSTAEARIANPTVFSNHVVTNHKLWNLKAADVYVQIGSMAKTVTKTLYDPCPPYYHVAPQDAFTTGWTDNTISGDQGRTNQWSDMKGIKVLTETSPSFGFTVDGVFLPFGGARLEDYGYRYVNAGTYYGGSWTSEIHQDAKAQNYGMLCCTTITPGSYLLFSFWSRYCQFAQASANLHKPVNCWPILPVYDANQ